MSNVTCSSHADAAALLKYQKQHIKSAGIVKQSSANDLQKHTQQSAAE
jgi:hypothetical protein